jgi:hypothetical protein
MSTREAMLSVCGTSSIASDLLRDRSKGEKCVGLKRLSAKSALVINFELVQDSRAHKPLEKRCSAFNWKA